MAVSEEKEQQEDDGTEACQRCGRIGPQRRILYVNGFGIEELRLPLRCYNARTDNCGLAHWGLVLCDDCLEDWWGAMGYWWIRAPGHELDEYPFPLLRQSDGEDA